MSLRNKLSYIKQPPLYKIGIDTLTDAVGWVRNSTTVGVLAPRDGRSHGPNLATPVFRAEKTKDKVERANMATHALFESASGYAIFEVKFLEDIGAKSHGVQESIKDLAKFGKMVNLLSFLPFKSAAQALENANDISEGDYR